MKTAGDKIWHLGKNIVHAWRQVDKHMKWLLGDSASLKIVLGGIALMEFGPLIGALATLVASIISVTGAANAAKAAIAAMNASKVATTAGGAAAAGTATKAAPYAGALALTGGIAADLILPFLIGGDTNRNSRPGLNYKAPTAVEDQIKQLTSVIDSTQKDIDRLKTEHEPGWFGPRKGMLLDTKEGQDQLRTLKGMLDDEQRRLNELIQKAVPKDVKPVAKNTTVNSNPTYNITVNAAPNQDIPGLIDKVKSQLQEQHAALMKASLWDGGAYA
jgi:hypothetical protein